MPHSQNVSTLSQTGSSDVLSPVFLATVVSAVRQALVAARPSNFSLFFKRGKGRSLSASPFLQSQASAFAASGIGFQSVTAVSTGLGMQGRPFFCTFLCVNLFNAIIVHCSFALENGQSRAFPAKLCRCFVLTEPAITATVVRGSYGFLANPSQIGGPDCLGEVRKTK